MARTRVDLYTVLGVRRQASAAEIRRAWQRHSRKLHPAVNPGDPTAAARFERISTAFAVLSDPEQRARYDTDGHTEPAAASPESEVAFEGFDFSQGSRRGSGVGFREIFDDVLEPGGGDRGAPRAGEDLEQTTRIGFRESLEGTSREIRLVRQGTCPACSGEGAVAIAAIPCPDCGGSGQIRARRGHMVFTKSCARCAGRGELDTRPCGRCQGEGRIPQADRLEIEIPAGVRDGSRVELPGAGNAGLRGGPPGKLTLVVQVEAHRFYERRGDDLYCRIPISMVEASLGAHVEVPTPAGPVTIEVPAGTQSGQRFRLLKRGVPHAGGGGRGDLYVEADVRVPRVTGDRARELLRDFDRLNPETPREQLEVLLEETAAADRRGGGR